MEFIYAHLALSDEADLKTCKLERSSSSLSGFVVKTDDGKAVDAFDYADRGLEQTLEVLSTLTVDRPLEPSDQFFAQELSQILVDFIYGPGMFTMTSTPNPDLTAKTTDTQTNTSATEDKKKKPSKPAKKSKKTKKKNNKKK